MSHAIYTTRALVCGSYLQNYSDKTFALYTEKAGMVFASAKSVREERSKQRQALQDFSRIRVSLIKGRQGWKIGSVEVLSNDFFVAGSREARGSVVMIYKLLRRFIKGEESSPELYSLCLAILDQLRAEVAERSILEAVAQIQILHQLGYVADSDLIKVNLHDSLIPNTGKVSKLELDKLLKDAVGSSHL